MQGVNVFEVMIRNKHAELLRVPNDYLWERSKAKTDQEREDVLNEANLKFFTIQQEMYSLADLNDRLFNQEQDEEY